MNKDESLAKFAEKLNVPLETIQTDFNNLVKEEGEIHPDQSDDDKNDRALRRLSLEYKKQLKSPAVGFEGMIIGVSDTFDMVRKARAEATVTFNEDPKGAILAGITDEAGTPLDTRPTWSTGRENPGFGKPLPEHSYISNIMGIGTKVNGSPKIFKMAIKDDLAENSGSIPMFKPIKFRAIDKSEEGDTIYSLNVSSVTKFNEDSSISVPAPTEAIKKFCADTIVDMSKLQEYHDANKDDFNRIVIIEGDVSALVMEPTATGSRRLIIEDANEEIVDLDSQGTTCWVPKNVNIDFAEQSRVYVIGRTAQGKQYVDGKATEEDGDIMMNVFGVYAIPEYKIAPDTEIQPLTVDNTAPDDGVQVDPKGTPVDLTKGEDFGNADVEAAPEIKGAEVQPESKEVQTELSGETASSL